jgi:predicted adenylyl cyclase CyaB
MSNHTYEIEIKSLLGSKEKADVLVKKMKKNDPGLQILGSHKQLNHYFEKGDLEKLKKALIDKVELAKKKLFEKICAEAQNYSLRTREADGKVLLVIKASIGDDTSANGVARMEFESLINLPLDKLDELILSCGFYYQAKWSRERQAFKYKNIDVTIDKNAGYGYLAEFEKQIENKSLTDRIRAEILNVMKELETEELAQDRLERMFAFYNQNWRDYYETDKIFTID